MSAENMQCVGPSAPNAKPPDYDEPREEIDEMETK